MPPDAQPSPYRVLLYALVAGFGLSLGWALGDGVERAYLHALAHPDTPAVPLTTAAR